MLRLAGFLVAVLAALLVVAGFAGALHRAADTLALGRPVFGAVALGGVLVARALPWRIGFAAVGLVALASVTAPLLPQSAGGDVRIYSKNLWAGNHDPSALVADIVAADVDAVFLQEVSDRNAVVLDLLKGSFPHQNLCRFSGWSGIALASREPFAGDPRCSSAFALAAAPIQLQETRVWLVSAHYPWPWPYDNAENELAAEMLLKGLDGAAVIAGDFNGFPWIRRVQRVAAVTGTRAAGPVRPTFFLSWIPFPIDMAFAPGGGALDRRPLLGSDHFGIVADLALEP